MTDRVEGDRTEQGASPPSAAMVDSLDHVFRHEYGRLVAALTRVFGPDRLDLVEDVVQDALLKAMRSWPFAGVPDDPAAWLTRVAHNLALDVVRHRKMAARKIDELAERLPSEVKPADDSSELVRDDTLRLMFTTCHPALPADARVALTLKLLCGFGTREIASGLLAKESSVAQRLTRAKAKLQRTGARFEVPDAADLGARVGSVLEVIYLVFNEGYRAHRGADLIRGEFVHEAIRLARQLAAIPAVARPELDALLSLMFFLAARLPARLDAGGELLTLAEQDRGLWDTKCTAAGFAHLERAARGAQLTAFHIEASIASLHAMAPSYAETDWVRILARYDDLLRLAPAPVVGLNRAVAVAKVDGIPAGRAALEALRADRELAEYHLLPVTAAHFAWLDGDRAAALEHYRAALALHCSEPERRLVERRQAACLAGEAPPQF